MWSFDGNGVCEWVAWGGGGDCSWVVPPTFGLRLSRLQGFSSGFCYVLLIVTTHGAELDSSWFSLSTPLDGLADLVEPDVIGPSRA